MQQTEKKEKPVPLEPDKTQLRRTMGLRVTQARVEEFKQLQVIQVRPIHLEEGTVPGGGSRKALNELQMRSEDITEKREVVKPLLHHNNEA